MLITISPESRLPSPESPENADLGRHRINAMDKGEKVRAPKGTISEFFLEEYLINLFPLSPAQPPRVSG
jgi:hypothetical protein